MLIILLIASLFMSCSKETSRKDRVLRINFVASPATVDPRKNGNVFSSNLIFMLYDGLTNLDANGNITLALAESVTISDDHKQYTFHLRDAYWSDGAKIVAGDFEYSWKSLLSPSFPSLGAYLFYPIKNAQKVKEGALPVDRLGVTALNDNTLQVTLEEPTSYFLNLISFATFFPIPAHRDETNPGWDKKLDLITSGPFRLENWDFHKKLSLKKSSTYWDASSVELNGLSISFISDEMTAYQLFEKGEFDFLGGSFSPLPLDTIPTLIKHEDFFDHPMAGTMICCFNTLRFPFNNINIRKAFSYAIDRQSIVDNITQNGELPATSFIPPILLNGKGSNFIDPGTKNARSYLDRGLEELGVDKRAFPETIFLYFCTETNHILAQALQNQWHQNLGVNVKLQSGDIQTVFSHLIKKDFQVALFLYISEFNDPMSILKRFVEPNLEKNYPSWENSDYLQAIRRVETTTNPVERTYFLKKAESVLIEEQPLAPLFHFNSTYLMKKYVKGHSLSPVRDPYFKWFKFVENRS